MSSEELVAKIYHTAAYRGESSENTSYVVALERHLEPGVSVAGGSPALQSPGARPSDCCSRASRTPRTSISCTAPKADLRSSHAPIGASWFALARTPRVRSAPFTPRAASSAISTKASVLVAPDATVKLIDCDSFQITAQGKRYLCEVGVETFTPPELQGKNLRQIMRTANHDGFGLAVMTVPPSVHGHGILSPAASSAVAICRSRKRYPNFGSLTAPCARTCRWTGPQIRRLCRSSATRSPFCSSVLSRSRWSTAAGRNRRNGCKL